VVAVSLAEFKKLPAGSWQFRDRQIWNISENEVAKATLQQLGRTRVILRNGDHNWSLAPGSQGMIEELPVEETVKGLCHMMANQWIAKGEARRAEYGITDQSHVVILHRKTGEVMKVEFGRETPSTSQYAGVTIDGQYFIFEFPWQLYRDVATYLGAP
jgi:hypothetical protein